MTASNEDWRLIAKKLSGEASSFELEELNVLLNKNYGLHDDLKILQAFWQQDVQNSVIETSRAFDKIWKRIN